MSMPALAPSALPTSGCLAVDTTGRVLPLRAAELLAAAGAGHARVTLRQTFHNPFAEPLDITYTLPLPADGAVAGYRFTVGEHAVVGEVQTKSRARETFETAILEGRTAALLDEERSSVFTQKLGNVPPGATLTCTITVDQPLAWEDGQWTWRFPTVVGPRYLGASPPPSAAGVVVEVATDAVPDATLTASLAIADALSGPVRSPSHPLDTRANTGAIDLGGALDRDVVVRWPVRQPTPGLTVQVARQEGQDDAFAAITVVPPLQPPSVLPRHLVVLLDTSGSMGGRPLDQAKEVAGALIRTLGPADHLELLAFASSVERFADAPMAMAPAARQRALAWLQQRRASGGTEMTTGIRAAVSGAAVPGAQKQVILVTDGYIGFEADIVGIALDERDRDTRVHTVGVGSSVNRSLTEPVARAGGGLELIVGIDEPAGPTAARLVAHTTAPVLVDLQLEGAVVRSTSHRLPDLYAGAPVTLFAAVDPAGGEVTLRGRSAEGEITRVVSMPAATDAGPAATRYARDQVADLELLCAAGRRVELREKRIEALGLGFQISTRFTSWVATTRVRTVDPDAESRHLTQPQALPHGVSAEGVGLRQAVAEKSEARLAFGAVTEEEAEEADMFFDREMTRSGVPRQAPKKLRSRAARRAPGAPPPPPSSGAGGAPPPQPTAKPQAVSSPAPAPRTPAESADEPTGSLPMSLGASEDKAAEGAPRPAAAPQVAASSEGAPKRAGVAWWLVLLLVLLGVSLGLALAAVLLTVLAGA